MPGGGRYPAGTSPAFLSLSRPCAPSGAETASARKASIVESLTIGSSNCRAKCATHVCTRQGRCQAPAQAVDLQAIVSQILQKGQNARARLAVSPRLEFGVHTR